MQYSLWRQSQRRPIFTRAPFSQIGKESDRKWEQGEDLSIIEHKTLVYTKSETARLVADPELRERCLQYSIRALANEAKVSANTVKAARSGKRLRRAIVHKLRDAVERLEAKQPVM